MRSNFISRSCCWPKWLNDTLFVYNSIWFLQKPNGIWHMIMEYLEFYQLITPVAAFMSYMEFFQQINNFWSEKGVESGNTPSEKNCEQHTWLYILFGGKWAEGTVFVGYWQVVKILVAWSETWKQKDWKITESFGQRWVCGQKVFPLCVPHHCHHRVSVTWEAPDKFGMMYSISLIRCSSIYTGYHEQSSHMAWNTEALHGTNSICSSHHGCLCWMYCLSASETDVKCLIG